MKITTTTEYTVEAGDEVALIDSKGDIVSGWTPLTYLTERRVLHARFVAHNGRTSMAEGYIARDPQNPQVHSDARLLDVRTRLMPGNDIELTVLREELGMGGWHHTFRPREDRR